MSETYQPTEAQIADVLARTGSDPRKLAIAYLRAQRRARDSDAAFYVMGSVNDLTLAVMKGDISGAQKAVLAAERRMKTHREIVD